MSSPIRDEYVLVEQSDGVTYQVWRQSWDTQFTPPLDMGRVPTTRFYRFEADIPEHEVVENPGLVCDDFFLYDPTRKMFRKVKEIR